MARDWTTVTPSHSTRIDKVILTGNTVNNNYIWASIPDCNATFAPTMQKVLLIRHVIERETEIQV